MRKRSGSVIWHLLVVFISITFTLKHSYFKKNPAITDNLQRDRRRRCV